MCYTTFNLSTRDFALAISLGHPFLPISLFFSFLFFSWSEWAFIGWVLWLLKLINKWVWLESQICTGWLRWHLIVWGLESQDPGEVGCGMLKGSVEHKWRVFISWTVSTSLQIYMYHSNSYHRVIRISEYLSGHTPFWPLHRLCLHWPWIQTCGG